MSSSRSFRIGPPPPPALSIALAHLTGAAGEPAVPGEYSAWLDAALAALAVVRQRFAALCPERDRLRSVIIRGGDTRDRELDSLGLEAVALLAELDELECRLAGAADDLVARPADGRQVTCRLRRRLLHWAARCQAHSSELRCLALEAL